MATLQSGKCFTVPTFFGMCCRSEWQERMYIYKWHEVDQTKHEIFCVHIVCNEIQVKVNLEITTFFLLFGFSILSQLFLIWGCTFATHRYVILDHFPEQINIKENICLIWLIGFSFSTFRTCAKIWLCFGSYLCWNIETSKGFINFQAAHQSMFRRKYCFSLSTSKCNV